MEKREETDKTESQEVERKLNGKQKKNVKVLCKSDLKKRVKTNDFSHLIAKGHRAKGIWYFSGYRKMCNASRFSPTPRNSLSVNIIRTDTLWIIPGTLSNIKKYGEKIKKIWLRKTLNGKVLRRRFNFLANKLKCFH